MHRINSNIVLGLVALGVGAALTGCYDHTVVRQRHAPGAPKQEVTVSSPGTAAAKEEQKQVVVTPATPTTPVVAVQPAPPPAPPTEVRTVSPAPDNVWVPGAYEWNNGRWEWAPGHWMVPAQPSATWVPGHWEAVPGGWQWQTGHWR